MLQILFDFFSGKAKTKIYTTFLGWLLILHIDLIFLAIFTDQSVLFEKTNQLKGEYIVSYLTQLGIWSVVIELSRIVLAVLISYLMIWIIPKLINEKSYKQELAIEYKLREMKVIQEEKLNSRESKAVEEQLQNIESEKEVVIERAKLDKNPIYIEWDSEFDEFMKLRNGKQALAQISNTIYSESGNLYNFRDGNNMYVEASGVISDDLALADTNGLVNISSKGDKLSLTDKGKYFIKKLNEHKSD